MLRLSTAILPLNICRAFPPLQCKGESIHGAVGGEERERNGRSQGGREGGGKKETEARRSDRVNGGDRRVGGWVGWTEKGDGGLDGNRVGGQRRGDGGLENLRGVGWKQGGWKENE